MTINRQGLLKLLGSGAGIFAAAFLLYRYVLLPTHWLETPEYQARDMLLNFRYQYAALPQSLDMVRVITIDDDTIRRLKQRWPFKRDVYANLLQRLVDVKPRVVAMDFIFSGQEDPLNDFQLAVALENTKASILAAFIDDSGNFVPSQREFQDVASGMGIANKFLDRDLMVRRGPIFYRDQNQKTVGWPWEMQVMKVLWGLDLENYQDRGDEVYFKGREKDLTLPLERGDRRFMINYRVKPKDLKTYSLWKVLDNDRLLEEFRGKIVLVGTTSKALHDFYQSPFGFIPGIVINSNMLLNLLDHDYLHEVRPEINAAGFALLILLAFFFGLRLSLLKALPLYLLLTVSYLLLAGALLFQNQILNFYIPLLAGWLTFLGTVFYRYFRMMLENRLLKSEVSHDPLTGVYNRRYFESKLDELLQKRAELERNKRKTDPENEVCLLMMDIDNFKKINDTYGHQVGDDVLKTVSFTVAQNIRKDDILARYGGEEFCVVFGHTSKEIAGTIAEKIRSAVATKQFNYLSQVCHFTISIGLAAVKQDGLYASRPLIRAADEALYEAKRSGKNKVCVYLAPQSPAE